jgi:hypothetical protein
LASIRIRDIMEYFYMTISAVSRRHVSAALHMRISQKATEIAALSTQIIHRASQWPSEQNCALPML